MRTCLLVLVVTSAAAASPLRMHYVEGENLHIANQGGAINWHADETITLDLGAKHAVELVSNGTRGEHNLYADGRNTDDDASWSVTWRGSWKQASDVLTLDLAVAKADCKAQRVETHPDRPAEKRACISASPKLTITCVSEDIALDKTKAPAWRCTVPSGSEIGETTHSLVFGKQQCIETIGGHRGYGYRTC